MIVKTDFQRGDAGALVDYIKYDRKAEEQRVPVRDPSGRDLSDADLEQFVERSEAKGMERHFIISPDPDATMSSTDLDRGTRRLLSDWRSGRPSASYVYAIHDAGEKPHVHAAVIGQERDLWMGRDDVVELREQARDAFREADRLPTRERQQQGEREAIPESARGPSRDDVE
ncbi:hypothetical protein SAMN05216559_3631 [Halomicrobium zhouii]|uniref:Relaxase/Mobilisation nuclease domain-containing protein n=1 Tax=Halomicrobium zhouii TaxID=767519 RepID=A0A1I6M2Q7_9EURY|nr:hypothetical protein [Halomicrobium zhouii]SFS09970.1 hypothetical protein SAMN05216559_3631 [Halomicrobium zhouii]